MARPATLGIDPKERLARRICKAANSEKVDINNVISSFRLRLKKADVDAAVKVALTLKWLSIDGKSYALTSLGMSLGERLDRARNLGVSCRFSLD